MLTLIVVVSIVGIGIGAYYLHQRYQAYKVRKEIAKIKQMNEDYERRQIEDAINVQALRNRLEAEDALRFTPGQQEVHSLEPTHMFTEEVDGLSVIHHDTEVPVLEESQKAGKEVLDRLTAQPLYDPEYKAFDYN